MRGSCEATSRVLVSLSMSGVMVWPLCAWVCLLFAQQNRSPCNIQHPFAPTRCAYSSHICQRPMQCTCPLSSRRKLGIFKPLLGLFTRYARTSSLPQLSNQIRLCTSILAHGNQPYLKCDQRPWAVSTSQTQVSQLTTIPPPWVDSCLAFRGRCSSLVRASCRNQAQPGLVLTARRP